MKEQIYSLLIKSLLALLTFITPIQPLVLGVVFLITSDFALGIWCAKRNNIPIQSKEMKRTVVKLFLYEFAVLIAFILDDLFVPGNIIVKVVSMIIGLTESSSIFEHISTLTGTDFWGAIKEKLMNTASSTTKENIKAIAESKKEPPISPPSA